MDETELQVNQVDNHNKLSKGLQNKGLVSFECANCGKSLLILQLVIVKNDNRSEILTRIAVKCGFCDGFSYVQQIPGQFYPGAPNDQMGFDILDDNTGAPEADVLFRTWSK